MRQKKKDTIFSASIPEILTVSLAFFLTKQVNLKFHFFFYTLYMSIQNKKITFSFHLEHGISFVKKKNLLIHMKNKYKDRTLSVDMTFLC
jgi:hypothetical protein